MGEAEKQPRPPHLLENQNISICGVNNSCKYKETITTIETTRAEYN